MGAGFTWTAGRVARRALVAGAAALVAGGGVSGDRAGAPPVRPGERVGHGLTARIRGFDPIAAGDAASAAAYAKIYEGLVQYAYLPRPYELEPLLAESMPEVSSDGLTYTFRLRPGIHFSDDPCFAATGGRGRELVAGDFVYSILRVADAKNASPGWWVFQDRLAGLDGFRARSAGREPTDYDAPVEGLRAPDARTLVLRLTRPCPPLLHLLTLHYAAAVPREAVERYGAEFGNHPVGTGPFALAAWRRNYRVEYVRNPAWRAHGRVERYPARGGPGDEAAGLLADAGREIPFVDRLVQYVVGDPSTQWQMLLRGPLLQAAVSRDDADAAIGPDGALDPDLRARGLELVREPTLDVYYLGFNMDDPVVGPNRALRQAMTCAFDTAEWERFHGGRARRPDGPVPPGAAGHAPRAPPFPFDPDRAKRRLEEAGYPGGIDPATGRRLTLTLEIADADNPEIRQSTDLLCRFMDRIGIVVRPSYNNRPAFFDKIARRQAQMFRLSWVADYPDAENFLQLFYSPNASPGPNRSNYRNPEYDALYERLRTMPDSPERTELAGRMVDLVMRDAPWILMHQPVYIGVRKAALRNHKHHAFPCAAEKYYRVEGRP
jgi:ABC-type transport system substrate-binding protein